MESIFRGILPLLRPKAHCVVNVPDMWWENRRITIHISLVEALRRAGYELRNIVIRLTTKYAGRSVNAEQLQVLARIARDYDQPEPALLAQADVLGIFGRENLDLATLWSPPDSSQPGAFAFRMYRNYDTNGHGFGNQSH